MNQYFVLLFCSYPPQFEPHQLMRRWASKSALTRDTEAPAAPLSTATTNVPPQQEKPKLGSGLALCISHTAKADEARSDPSA